MTLHIVFIIAIFLFVLRTAFFLIGCIVERKKHRIDLINENLPFISVIVPGRNEESNIAECINSIASNDYPKDRYEIIAIDDRSTDNTGKILDDLKSNISNLKVLHIRHESEKKNLQGKPGALQFGIDNSQGELILMTDADCTASPKWIRAHATFYQNNDNLGLTAAYTDIKGSRIFDKLQATEWVYMHAMAVGSFGCNMPLSCYGNNVSVRSKDFYNVGGYKKIAFSITEDLALLHAVYNSGKSVGYASIPESHVRTLPNKNFKEYLKQHHRWAIGGIALGWKAVAFVTTSLAIWTALAVALISAEFAWGGIVLGSRIFLDALLLIPSLRAVGRLDLLKWLIPAILFFVSMELVAPFFLLKRNISWKDQIFKH